MSELTLLLGRVERTIEQAVHCDHDSHEQIARRSHLMARVYRELLTFARHYDIPAGWAGQMLLQLTRAKERGA